MFVIIHLSKTILFIPSKKRDMEFIKELFLFLKTRKRYWLIPLIVVFVLCAALIVLSSVPALAPFIYTIF